jgi:hypothetical protein
MAEFIKQSLLFPVIQSVHIIGLTILVGTIFLVDLRLLGIGRGNYAARDIASVMAPWTSAGLLAMLVTGPLMFWSDLTRYLNNPAFVLKMGLLAVALGGHFTLHRSAVRDGTWLNVTRQRLAAALSLLLWSSVVVAGRAIADFDIRRVV